MKTSIKGATLKSISQSLKDDGIQKTVVGAIVTREHKVLLVRRIPNDFMGGLVELPSGGVDRSESILEALIRELKEETNLSILSIDQYVGSFDYVSGSGKKARQLNFAVSATGKIVLNPEEHDLHFWLHPKDKEFSNLNISASTKRIIETAFGG